MNFHIIEGSHIFVRPVNKILPSSAFMKKNSYEKKHILNFLLFRARLTKKKNKSKRVR